jgi:hypothetical protein
LLETSRWCDRSIRDVRHSVGPSGTPETATLFGTPVAETILASGHVRPRQQAGHMIASDPIRTLNSSCKPGAVHIWVPDLRSRCALARPGHEGGVAAHTVCSLARSEPRAPSVSRCQTAQSSSFPRRVRTRGLWSCLVWCRRRNSAAVADAAAGEPVVTLATTAGPAPW